MKTILALDERSSIARKTRDDPKTISVATEAILSISHFNNLFIRLFFDFVKNNLSWADFQWITSYYPENKEE